MSITIGFDALNISSVLNLFVYRFESYPVSRPEPLGRDKREILFFFNGYMIIPLPLVRVVLSLLISSFSNWSDHYRVYGF